MFVGYFTPCTANSLFVNIHWCIYFQFQRHNSSKSFQNFWKTSNKCSCGTPCVVVYVATLDCVSYIVYSYSVLAIVSSYFVTGYTTDVGFSSRTICRTDLYPWPFLLLFLTSLLCCVFWSPTFTWRRYIVLVRFGNRTIVRQKFEGICIERFWIFVKIYFYFSGILELLIAYNDNK